MNFFNDHKRLFITALALFLFLTLLVAIMPALYNQANNQPLPGAEALSEDATAGKAVFIANGCVACHSQQVRNVDMDKIWGERPGVAADYAANVRTDFWRNTATLMGTERTGPDLTNIGNRQPSSEWHLLHLYQPRAVVAQSIMPAYPWMFEVKDKLESGDVEITVPDNYRKNIRGKIVAKKEALQLVAYLQSLKQVKLTDTSAVPKFLYKRAPKSAANMAGGVKEAALDGNALYATHCQSCHQANGEGLKGAFPPLKGSLIVLDESPEKMIDIIMNGYNARPGFAVMPPIGTTSNLTDAEIAAIINHERSSWGNNARNIPHEEVKKILDLVKQVAKK
ncbi:MAG TPA: cbb3-type cytochrome c oxidase subunit II [Daejeonella sp.]|nr:cbb3-type cytochrome c oxidase subunit II [Daejeonella sp.]